MAAVPVPHCFIRILTARRSFHVMVNEALDAPSSSSSIHLIELHQPMTNKMKAIQRAILSLIDACLREMIKAHPAVRPFHSIYVTAKMEDHLTMENALLKRSLFSLFEGTSLSANSRQILSSVATLRSLGQSLMHDHAIGFLQAVETAIMAERALYNDRRMSIWLCMDESDVIAKVVT